MKSITGSTPGSYSAVMTVMWVSRGLEAQQLMEHSCSLCSPHPWHHTHTQLVSTKKYSLSVQTDRCVFSNNHQIVTVTRLKHCYKFCPAHKCNFIQHVHVLCSPRPVSAAPSSFSLCSSWQSYTVLIYLHLGIIKKDRLTAIKWIKIYYTTCLFKVCVCVWR